MVAQAGKDKFTPLQACALNTLNMFGTGPFITIPYVIASMSPPGPHALIGYAVVSVACVMDSLIWAELGSMWLLSGGSYIYLMNLYGPNKLGRLMGFLFVWQFLVTAPMEIASGFIAIAQYLSYITGDTSYWHNSLLAFFFCLLAIFGLFRNVSEIGKLTLILWGATLVAIVFTIVAGLSHFNVSHFDVPDGAFSRPGTFLWSMGAVCRFGVYDFTGYYDVNQIGEDLHNPATTIPFAVTRTCAVLCVVYFLVHISVIGYFPWDGPDGFVRLVDGTSEGSSNYIMSLFCERMLGSSFATFFTCVVCVTIFGANFAMMCGSLYVPFAAAKRGHFFSALAKTDPTRGDLPTVSLQCVGFLSLVFCFFRLDLLVHAMMTIMLLVQFLGQSVGLLLHRYKTGAVSTKDDTWRMPFFPLPCFFQIVVFSFVFITTDNYILLGNAPLLELALAFLFAGCAAYFIWARRHYHWPFDRKEDTDIKKVQTSPRKHEAESDAEQDQIQEVEVDAKLSGHMSCSTIDPCNSSESELSDGSRSKSDSHGKSKSTIDGLSSDDVTFSIEKDSQSDSRGGGSADRSPRPQLLEDVEDCLGDRNGSHSPPSECRAAPIDQITAL